MPFFWFKTGTRGSWVREEEEEDDANSDHDYDEDSSQSLCRSVRRSYFSPQVLRATDGKLHTVINHNKYRQYIEIEECINPRSRYLFPYVLRQILFVKCFSNRLQLLILIFEMSYTINHS